MDFFNLVRSRPKFRLYLLKNLPSAFFSGLRVAHADEQYCVVTIYYRWFTRNPFRSIYFACLSMAAEMSTGVLVMAQTYNSDPKVSMLVTGLEATFTKKATGRVSFACRDGEAIREAIERAKTTGEPQSIKTKTSGISALGEPIAEFFITWSFKVKK